MKLLFNHNDQGQAEIKATLGFLDGNFTYANLEPDIKLNTPYLIDLISQDVYDKIATHYESSGEDEDINLALDYCRIYILSMAYLAYAPNNDLTHSNSGRSFRNESDEKIPWEWQINKDNSAIARRAYMALDHLFISLDSFGWTEWTSSDAYQKANSLFIKSTKIFESAFPINKSGQLYYRLVPFMSDYETDYVIPIITPTVSETLKSAESPTSDQQILLSYIYKSIAYLSLAKAYKTFPVEMFAEGLMYNENTRMKSEARAEVMLFLQSEGEKYLKKLENEYQRQNETFETLKTTNGLEEGKKYVNL